jgi:biopolymer transport protein ExbD
MSNPLYSHQKYFSWAQQKTRRKYQIGFLGGAFLFDVAMLWVGFYIATSSFVLKPGVIVDLPEMNFSAGVSHQATILSITHDNRIFYDDEQITLKRLNTLLTNLDQTIKLIPLVVEADQQADYGTIVNVWHIAQQAGMKQISLATGLGIKSNDLER